MKNHNYPSHFHSPKYQFNILNLILILDSEVNVLDLSNKSLKKIPKTDDAQSIKVLLLDDNDLQKIDNIDSYLKIEKVRG